MNATNNRLESLNGKFNQISKKYSSLNCFLEQFVVILPVLRDERSYIAVYSYQKVQVTPYALNSPEAGYTNLLTSYASDFVQQQLNLPEETSYEFDPDIRNPGTYNTNTRSK